MLCKSYRENCENRYCFGFHKQCETLFRDHMVRLKMISLYIYIKNLRSSETRGHYHEDGNLVPSPRCGLSFEVAFQLWCLKFNNFRIHRKCEFPVKFVVFLIILHSIVWKIFSVKFQVVELLKCIIFSVKVQELFLWLGVKIWSFLTIFRVNSKLFQFSILSTFQNLEFQGK